jgi:hypothetical protein
MGGLGKVRYGAALIAAFLPFSPAWSYDWSAIVKVTSIELTGFPAYIDFKVDQNMGTCNAGQLIFWYPNHHAADANAQGLNAQAVLSGLMSAQLSSRYITVYGSNSGCEINFIYVN